MLASRLAPRTRSQSLVTWLARYTTAWPAELPAPTSATSCAAQSFPSSGEAQLETPVLAGRAASQTHDFVGYRHLGAELLRLVVRARHERHAGDPGGKAHVVLDPGRRAGLSAEGAAIEHDHRQPFGGRVD